MVRGGLKDLPCRPPGNKTGAAAPLLSKTGNRTDLKKSGQLVSAPRQAAEAEEPEVPGRAQGCSQRGQREAVRGREAAGWAAEAWTPRAGGGEGPATEESRGLSPVGAWGGTRARNPGPACPGGMDAGSLGDCPHPDAASPRPQPKSGAQGHMKPSLFFTGKASDPQLDVLAGRAPPPLPG